MGPFASRYEFIKKLSDVYRNTHKLKIVAQIVHLLIKKLLKHSINLHISEIPSPVYNAKILSEYLAYRISKNPYYHKPVVMEALRASKISS